MRREQDWFSKHQTQVAVVTFEQAWRAEGCRIETGLSWPILLDHDRSLYSYYGMQRGSKTKVLGIRNWLSYIRLIFQGYRVQRPTDDIYQLGGDVLVDPQGIVRMHFVSDSPIDRPSVESITHIIKPS